MVLCIRIIFIAKTAFLVGLLVWAICATADPLPAEGTAPPSEEGSSSVPSEEEGGMFANGGRRSSASDPWTLPNSKTWSLGSSRSFFGPEFRFTTDTLQQEGLKTTSHYSLPSCQGMTFETLCDLEMGCGSLNLDDKFWKDLGSSHNLAHYQGKSQLLADAKPDTLQEAWKTFSKGHERHTSTPCCTATNEQVESLVREMERIAIEEGTKPKPPDSINCGCFTANREMLERVWGRR